MGMRSLIPRRSHVTLPFVLAACAWFCVAANTSAAAEDRHSASARLQIEFVVVPTAVASQTSMHVQQPSSVAPVTFDLQSQNQKPTIYASRNFSEGNKPDQRQRAVLKTMTVVPD